jgi:hypothetical protein
VAFARSVRIVNWKAGRRRLLPEQSLQFPEQHPAAPQGAAFHFHEADDLTSGVSRRRFASVFDGSGFHLCLWYRIASGKALRFVRTNKDFRLLARFGRCEFADSWSDGWKHCSSFCSSIDR